MNQAQEKMFLSLNRKNQEIVIEFITDLLNNETKEKEQEAINKKEEEEDLWRLSRMIEEHNKRHEKNYSIVEVSFSTDFIFTEKLNEI